MNDSPDSTKTARLEAEIELLRAALNVALAYATGLVTSEAHRDLELSGAREALLSTGILGRQHKAITSHIFRESRNR